jgi:hypothetical protein
VIGSYFLRNGNRGQRYPWLAPFRLTIYLAIYLAICLAMLDCDFKPDLKQFDADAARAPEADFPRSSAASTRAPSASICGRPPIGLRFRSLELLDPMPCDIDATAEPDPVVREHVIDELP